MPVVLLIGTASRFIEQIVSYFGDKYECCVLEEPFVTVRSQLATQEEQKLYVVPHLTKPERYEVFCLARKNRQLFLSIVDKHNNEATASDKNQMLMGDFDGLAVQNELLKSRVAPTAANKRSKGISLRSLGDLKAVIQRVNREYVCLGNIDVVSRECEDRITKAWSLGAAISLDEAEECYRKLMDQQLKSKGVLK